MTDPRCGRGSVAGRRADVLLTLHVRNLAVLSEATLDLGTGLNVLSGETGAGKSIVVDALELLAGVRAASDLIRTGSDTLSVTGIFRPAASGWRERLAEAGVETQGDELVIRREVRRDGRNRAFVEDQPVTQRLLADLAPELLRIHGQRQELELANPELQRGWLDRAGGAEAVPLVTAVAAAAAVYRKAAERLARVSVDERQRAERIEWLRFQVREIEGAGLAVDEEASLRAERQVLRHAEAIQEALAGAAGLLAEEEGAASDRLQRACQLLAGVADWEPAAGGWVDQLDGLQIQVDELAMSVGRRLAAVEADPGRLDAVEERLALLERLFRKHGPSSEAVLARGAALATELTELETDAADRQELEARCAEALSAYRQAAEALSRGRRKWGQALAARVERELAELAMAKARFAIRIEPQRRSGGALTVDGVEVDAAPHGVDQVTFELSANPGEALRPLARVASGGELSRVYLALQLAVRADGEAVDATLVFDEVDAGIGGREAAVVGRKLARLAAGGQVLAATHLPQLASCADHHFRVQKSVREGRTWVAVELLDAERRVEEVARMLAGKQVTELSRSHARELIAAAQGGG